MTGTMQPLEFRELPEQEMRTRAAALADELSRRRSVRDFSDRSVPIDIIENGIRAAGSAPSGANRQPWHFVVVKSPETKRLIREAAEKEEREFYSRRAPQAWLEALAPLGTDENKPFLEVAPYLIVIFYERYGIDRNGEKFKTYFAPESVGIATGLLISVLHQAGLVTLTHTPSPMKFLRKILGRPENESPFLILVVGHPAENAQVPGISRKHLRQIMTTT